MTVKTAGWFGARVSRTAPSWSARARATTWHGGEARNGEREGWFCVPWRDGNIWRGFFPDLLVVREDGERLVVDIIDPHDHTKPDAVGKAKGLSAYAAVHAEQVGHIDLVAKVGSRYRRLHLDQSAIRRKVDAVASTGELLNLYQSEG